MSELSRLTSVDQVAPLVERSRQQPVLIFKHSLTCPVSTAAYRAYQRFLEDRPEGDSTCYTLIEIQNARDVSNEVARLAEVRHESPQAILLRDGTVSWHASHWDIQEDSLRAAVSG